jgi:hypothetical protein
MSYKALEKQDAFKSQLWRKPSPSNTKVLEMGPEKERYQKEMNLGFVVESNPTLFIHWETTIEGLLNYSIVDTIQDDGITKYYIKYPVRIGHLVLDHLWLQHDSSRERSDIPLRDLYSQAVVEGNGDKNYFLIHQALEDLEAVPFGGYHRENIIHSEWDFNGLRISLTYWYDDPDYGYDSGYASLSFSNNRVYTQYITSNYVMSDQVDVLFCQRKLVIPDSYRKSRHYRLTPDKIKALLLRFKKGTVLFIDRESSTIGIANEEYAYIISRECVKCIELLNIIPAKGEGGSSIIFLLTDNKRIEVLAGEYGELNDLAAEYCSLIDMEFNILKEYYDC